MNKKVYVCIGTCKANISEERYKNGLTKCGEKTCTMFGEPFEEKIECSVCGHTYSSKEEHFH